MPRAEGATHPSPALQEPLQDEPPGTKHWLFPLSPREEQDAGMSKGRLPWAEEEQASEKPDQGQGWFLDRKGDQEGKKELLIICRLSLDKCGGKCHSIQQQPRAAACLDTAFPEFLLITAWEIFGGGVCLCLLDGDFSPTGRRRGGNSIILWRAPWMVHGVWGARLGTGRIALCQGHCHWDGDTAHVPPVAPQLHPSARMLQLPQEQPATVGSS